MSAHTTSFWKVVMLPEGEDGLVVRRGDDPESADCEVEDSRLPLGAVVRQIKKRGEFLQFELASLEGPANGWVSTISEDWEEYMERCEDPNQKGPSVTLGPADAKVLFLSLSDPTYLSALQTKEVTLSSGLKAMVTCRPDGAPKAPLSIVMLPGNPVVGGWHSSLPLPMAMEKGFAKAGIAVVRFDWAGTGMNKIDGYPHNQGYEDKLPVVFEMYELAKTVSERIAFCTWNYSGTMLTTFLGDMKTMVADSLPELAGLVSVSFAYKQWEFAKRFQGEAAGEWLKAEFDRHSLLKIPVIYAFGSRDVHTPLEDVERLVNARADGGKDVTIYVVNQDGQKLHPPDLFSLRDKEEEVAVVCASWASELRAKVCVGTN